MQQHGHGTPNHKLKLSEMMDSQENNPTQGIEEEQKAAPAAPVTDNSTEEPQKETASETSARRTHGYRTCQEGVCLQEGGARPCERDRGA